MKNNKKLVLASLAGLATLGMNSCGKYEEGPNFSLLTKKARLSREWDLKSIGDQTIDQVSGGYGLTMSFDKDGSFKWAYSDNTGSQVATTGTWEFSSDKEFLIVKTENNPDADTVEIKKLTNKELWLDDDNSSADGDIWKLEAK